MPDIEETLSERGSRYGDFGSHAEITQSIKDIMKNTENWKKLKPYQKEALEMVAHKIGRILNGDPTYIDSYIDIIGYTQLVINKLNGNGS